MDQNGSQNVGALARLEEEEVEEEGVIYYTCKFCPKKFSNSQALGGHQNAHKLERAVAKQQQKMAVNGTILPSSAYGYPVGSGTHNYYPYQITARLPPLQPYYPRPYSVPPQHFYSGLGLGYHGVPAGVFMQGGGGSSSLVPNRPPVGPTGFYPIPNPVPDQEEGSGDSEEVAGGDSGVDTTLKL